MIVTSGPFFKRRCADGKCFFGREHADRRRHGAVALGAGGRTIDPHRRRTAGAHLARFEADKPAVEGLCLAGVEDGRYRFGPVLSLGFLR